MEPIIKATNLTKKIDGKTILDGVGFSIFPGQIVGLVGPNGAGKTTLLKSILGLSSVEGDLSVLGMAPIKDREKLIENVSFIADTAILPSWMTVGQLVEFIEGIHPKFNREKAMRFLRNTHLEFTMQVKKLSKGMITQLHLALIMAIDSQLLVLDEPTLGLDIIYRKQFYESLLNDYYDQNKTIIITTHQIEEIEGILTYLMFIDQGKIVLDLPMDQLEHEFIELQVDDAKIEQALAYKPIYQRRLLGGSSFIYRGADQQTLSNLGKLVHPSLADVFVGSLKSNI